MTAAIICQEFEGENWGQPGLCLVFADKEGEGRYSVETPSGLVDGRCLQSDAFAFWAQENGRTGETPEDLPELSACPRVEPAGIFVPRRMRRANGQESLTEFPEFQSNTSEVYNTSEV